MTAAALGIIADGLTIAGGGGTILDACPERGERSTNGRRLHAALLRVNPRCALAGPRRFDGAARSPKPTPPAQGVHQVRRRGDGNNDFLTVRNAGRRRGGGRPGESSGNTN